jgi:hypothetical protein
MLLITAGILSIAAIIVILAVRDGLVGILAGTALVGLTSLVTLYFAYSRLTFQSSTSRQNSLTEFVLRILDLIGGN